MGGGVDGALGAGLFEWIGLIVECKGVNWGCDATVSPSATVSTTFIKMRALEP